MDQKSLLRGLNTYLAQVLAKKLFKIIQCIKIWLNITSSQECTFKCFLFFFLRANWSICDYSSCKWDGFCSVLYNTYNVNVVIFFSMTNRPTVFNRLVNVFDYGSLCGTYCQAASLILDKLATLWLFVVWLWWLLWIHNNTAIEFPIFKICTYKKHLEDVMVHYVCNCTLLKNKCIFPSPVMWFIFTAERQKVIRHIYIILQGFMTFPYMLRHYVNMVLLELLGMWLVPTGPFCPYIL